MLGIVYKLGVSTKKETELHQFLNNEKGVTPLQFKIVKTTINLFATDRESLSIKFLL